MNLKEPTVFSEQKKGELTRYEYFTIWIYAEGFSRGNPSGCDHSLYRNNNRTEENVHDLRCTFPFVPGRSGAGTDPWDKSCGWCCGNVYCCGTWD